MTFRTLEGLDVRGKRVLLRVDLNVPMADGKVTDLTRIVRQAPTIRELADKGARVIILAHFERPGGKVVPSMSLKPVVPAVAEVIGHKVAFAGDCVGPVAESAVASLKDGLFIII
jgi:phosphoglycerate kinase